MSDNIQKKNQKSLLVFLSTALLIGVFLRLSFPGDIEYNGDQQFLFGAGQEVGVTRPWPLVGSNSSAGFNNPGLSMWIFVVLTRIAHATNPPELARAVQVMNILALCMLGFFSLRLVPKAERLLWCWATAFAAVSSTLVVWNRKISSPSTFPLFCMGFWISWHYRQKRAGAFFWGLIGACLGQIHMSGFMFAAGVFLWTVFHDRRAKWGSWFLGSLVGVIPMIPWLQYMVAQPGHGFNWLIFLSMFYPKYWIYWVSDALGLGLANSLKTIHYLDMLRYPLIGGTATYLCAIAHVAIIVCVILILVSVRKKKGFFLGIRDTSETGLGINSVMFGAGILMSITIVNICRHYLLVTFPLEWVWLSRMGLGDKRVGQRYLLVIWIAQLIISVSFLLYIHINHGDTQSDYGITYQFQAK